jgi:hypothetical protein
MRQQTLRERQRSHGLARFDRYGRELGAWGSAGKDSIGVSQKPVFVYASKPTFARRDDDQSSQHNRHIYRRVRLNDVQDCLIGHVIGHG